MTSGESGTSPTPVPIRRATPKLVSVIIPCLNASATLREQLDALAAQEPGPPWEVVLVDNGSTDGSPHLARGYADRLDLRIVPSNGCGVSEVRNDGAHAARGDLLAFCDADDVVSPGWLAALVTASRNADIVGGRLDDRALNDERTVAWRGPLLQDALMRPLDYLPFAPGGNCAIWRDVFEMLRGWDPQYVAGSDDVDFSWRAQAAGFTLAFAPDAVLSYRYRRDLLSTCRQFYRYGQTEALLYARYRSGGLQRYRRVDVLRRWWRIVKWTPRAARSTASAGAWCREVSYRLGRLRGSIKHGVVLP